MMTDDELDLLASSYLDGEATSDEVALVEGDPDLRARVGQLRSVRVTSVAATPGLAQAQIARAMAGFVPGVGADATDESVDRAPGTETVIDLSERRRQREGRLRWLTSAAAVLVVGIGAVAVINQMGGGDEAEMATADVASEATEAAEAETAEAEAAGADEAASMAESVEEAADEGAETLAGDAAEEAVAEAAEAADAEEALTLDESAADVDAAPGAERILRNLPESGFFPDDPVAQYNRLPTGDEMVGDLELPWRDEATASCLDAFPSDDSPYAFDEVEVIAYLPFEVIRGDDAGVYEALYVIVNEAEEVVVVLRPGDCTPVSD